MIQGIPGSTIQGDLLSLSRYLYTLRFYCARFLCDFSLFHLLWIYRSITQCQGMAHQETDKQLKDCFYQTQNCALYFGFHSPFNRLQSFDCFPIRMLTNFQLKLESFCSNFWFLFWPEDYLLVVWIVSSPRQTVISPLPHCDFSLLLVID